MLFAYCINRFFLTWLFSLLSYYYFQALPFMPGTLVVGLCVPSTCSEQDVFNLINAGKLEMI